MDFPARSSYFSMLSEPFKGRRTSFYHQINDKLRCCTWTRSSSFHKPQKRSSSMFALYLRWYTAQASCSRFATFHGESRPHGTPDTLQSIESSLLDYSCYRQSKTTTNRNWTNVLSPIFQFVLTFNSHFEGVAAPVSFKLESGNLNNSSTCRLKNQKS